MYRLTGSAVLLLLITFFACHSRRGNKGGHITQDHKKESPKTKVIKAEKPKKDEWKLEWSEGFEHLDGSLWAVRDIYKGEGITGFNPANAGTDDGHLVLSLNNEPYYEKSFSGAEVYGSREIAFGRMDVKMKIPKGRGIACSLCTSSLVGAGKKAHDEISIEFRGSETRTAYFNYFRRTERQGNGNSYFVPFDASENFHVYSIERSHRFIKWYIDGKLYYQSYEKVPGSALRIVFSIWATSEQISHEILPAHLYIDYINYFSRNR